MQTHRMPYPPIPRPAQLLLLAVAIATLPGCVVVSTVGAVGSAAVSVASTAVSVVGTAVSTTASVAGSAVSATVGAAVGSDEKK